MSLTAATLITAAKKRTYGAHGRQKISEPALLEELNFQDMMLVQEIAQMAPDLLATVDGQLVVVSTENQYGYLLDAGIHYRDFVHVDTVANKYTPITLYQRQYQESQVKHPAGMVNLLGSAGTFYPIDPAGKRWKGTETPQWFDEAANHEIHYSYVPLPTVMTSLSDTITSPDMAREVLVTALELAILLGNPETPEIRLQSASGRYSASRLSLTWQINKFANPQGARHSGRGGRTDGEWVAGEIG